MLRRSVVPILMLCVATFGCQHLSAVPKAAKPDFAYPATVAADSKTVLDNALRGAVAPSMLRSLLNLSLAETAISPDSVEKVIARISEISMSQKDPAVRSLLDILQAKYYAAIYSNDRQAYEQRPDVVVDSENSDYRTWSASRIVGECTALIDRALASPDALRVPLDIFSSAVSLTKGCSGETFTVLDFVGEQAYDILKSIEYGHPEVAKAKKNVAELMLGLTAPDFVKNVGWRIKLSACSDMLDLFDKYFDLGPESGEYLINAFNCGETDASADGYYHLAQIYLYRYPHYYRAEAVRNILKVLSAKQVQASMATTVYPGTNISIALTAKNVNKCTVLMYSVPSTTPWRGFYDPAQDNAKPIYTTDVTFNGEIPFSESKTVEIPVAKEGRYVIDVTYDGAKISSNRNLLVVTATKLSTFYTTFSDRTVYAVDALSGAPQKGVNIDLLKNSGKKQLVSSLGVTDGNGSLTLPNKSNGTLMATLRTDKTACQSVWGFSPDKVGEWSQFLYGTASLPIYHPGDSVEWVAIAYESAGFTHRLLTNRTIKAELHDPTFDIVDTLSVTTDEWGRVSGSFVLPKDRMTGTYNMALLLPGAKEGSVDASQYISLMVSDYREPSFEIVDLKTEPSTDGYVIQGILRTFTGIALPNAEILIDLRSVERRLWWRFSAESKSYTAINAKSDEQGRIDVLLPDSLLDAAPYPRGIFTAVVTARLGSGESVQATTMFTREKLCTVEAEIPNVIDISKPVTFKVSAKSLDEELKNTEFTYNILKDNTLVKSGLIASGRTVDLSSVTPGRYDIAIKIANDSTSEAYSQQGVTLYSSKIGSPSPSTAPLWSPSAGEISADYSGKVSLNYALLDGDNNILVLTGDPINGKLLSRKWMKVNGGFRRHDLDMPAGVDYVDVTMVCTRAFRTEVLNFYVKRANPHGDLRVVASSMRDRTTPLAQETWRFKLEYTDGTPAEGALVLDMYSKALEQLASPQSYNFVAENGNLRRINVFTSHMNNAYVNASTPIDSKEVPEICAPDWQLWGQPLLGAFRNYFMAKGGLMMSRAVNSEMVMNVVTEESAMDMGSDGLSEGGSAAELDKPSSVDYRPSEMPLAFFNPHIVTNDDGSYEVEVKIPNSLTTWQFNALAWTKNVNTASLSKQIVVSKPVYVSPNLPRFVRAGDEVMLPATVYNTTDSVIEATVRYEVSTLSGKMMHDSVFSLNVAPNSSSTSFGSLSVNVPSGELLDVRVSVSTNAFTDGERATIPVLASTASVIESTPFYIEPKQNTAEVEIQHYPSDATLTLQYCDNPLWLAVLALPVATDVEPYTSIEAVSTLFATIVGERIVSDYPGVANAIKEWNSSDKSSESLSSMLQRNQQLKQLLLQQTPWMHQAATDTERMERLALLLDTDYISKIKAKSLTKLTELSAGGFRWIASDAEASYFATERVLSLFGSLSRLHWLPNDRVIMDMISNSLKWYDARTEEMYQKYPKALYLSYALIRDNFAQAQPQGAKQITVNVVKDAKRNWKKQDAVTKARMAILLDHNGASDVSRDILRSLSEYALRDPSRGMWWSGVDIYSAATILDAYALLNSGSDDIDQIRQWIIFEKQANNFTSDSRTAYLIADLLSSSTKWVKASPSPSFTYGDSAIKTNKADFASGYLTVELPSPSSSVSTLKVQREGEAPAWGAIVAQYTSKASDVAPHNIQDLSIRKRILVEQSTSEGVKWVEADSVPFGANAKIELTVKAHRDMQYVTVVDTRAASLQPREQTPAPLWSQGLCFYRENRDAETRLFISNMPKGTYVLTYDVYASVPGIYTDGIATIQSQLNPSLTAHSGADILTVYR